MKITKNMRTFAIAFASWVVKQNKEQLESGDLTHIMTLSNEDLLTMFEKEYLCKII